jgi:hypothetical protein
MAKFKVADSTDVNICCADVIILENGRVFYHPAYFDSGCNDSIMNDPIYWDGTVESWKDTFDELSDEEISNLTSFSDCFTKEPHAFNISTYIAYYGCQSIHYGPIFELKEFLKLCGQKLCGLHS